MITEKYKMDNILYNAQYAIEQLQAIVSEVKDSKFASERYIVEKAEKAMTSCKIVCGICDEEDY